MHQKPDQMEKTRWEGQNFSEVVVPEEEEEEEEVFASGGLKHARGSRELIPYSTVQYLETLKRL